MSFGHSTIQATLMAQTLTVSILLFCFFKQASGCQVTQPPPGPPSLRDDGQLPELRQGEGALQGQVRPAQQPAGLPRRETGLDTGRYGGQRATF